MENTALSGAGSLKQAILDANATAGADEIVFNIPGDGPHIISPTFQEFLPAIMERVTINGYSQPGAQPNTGTIVNTAVIKIQIDGAAASSNHGLTLRASGNVIRGLSITRFGGDAINIQSGGHNNTIAGNFLGINALASNTADGGNRDGILMTSSSGNTIGGTAPADANLLSDNSQFGIYIQSGAAPSSDNVIVGNWIGLAANGGAKGNSAGGVKVLFSQRTRIGGGAAGERNVVSGNSDVGFWIESSTETVVQGNYIGTDATGTLARANFGGGLLLFESAGNRILGNVISGNSGRGIALDGAANDNAILSNLIGVNVAGVSLRNNSHGIYLGSSPNRNQIGDGTAGGANTIANNNGAGVWVAGGTGNAIRGNSIFLNTGLGIDLGDAGFSPGDEGDADVGANNLQNFPALNEAAVTPTSLVVRGRFNSAASSVFTLDFYATPGTEAEGRFWVGSRQVTTDAGGNAAFEHTIAAPHTLSLITATATDGQGNTSEFSAALNPRAFVPIREFTVTTAADSGPGSLRQALLDVNSEFSFDTIRFAIPGAGTQVINILSPLPAPQDELTIDGFSQGAQRAANDPRWVELNGSALSGNQAGLVIGNAGIVRGLGLVNFPGAGLEVAATQGARIEGNWIGITSARGAGPNRGGGIRITGGAATVTGCYISGNQASGIQVGGAGSNTIQGNWIGMRPAENALLPTAILPNEGNGIRIENSPANQIGGTTGSVTNVISGNGLYGIEISGAASALNKIEGNIIGTDGAMTRRLGNQRGGIHITDSANQTGVGTIAASARNYIAHNLGHGVWVESGHKNSILGNIIVGNSNKPIFVAPGANGGVTPPIITSATVGSTILTGYYEGLTAELKRFQAFSTYPFDPDNPPPATQLFRHHSSDVTTTTPPGRVEINRTYSDTPPSGSRIFITATEDGNTIASEVTPIVEPVCDVSVTKVGPADGAIHREMTYTITVSNAGPAVARNVALDDFVSDFVVTSATGSVANAYTGASARWTIGDLAVGQSITVTIIGYPTDTGLYLNRAKATTTTLDSNTANNQAETTTFIGLPAAPPKPKHAGPQNAGGGSETAFVAPGSGVITVTAPAIVDQQTRVVTIPRPAASRRLIDFSLIVDEVEPTLDIEETVHVAFSPTPQISLNPFLRDGNIIVRATGLPPNVVTANAAPAVTGPWHPIQTISSSIGEAEFTIPFAQGTGGVFINLQDGPPAIEFNGNQFTLRGAAPPGFGPGSAFELFSPQSAAGSFLVDGDGFFSQNIDATTFPNSSVIEHYFATPFRTGPIIQTTVNRVPGAPSNPPAINIIPNLRVTPGTPIEAVPIIFGDADMTADLIVLNSSSSNPQVVSITGLPSQGYRGSLSFGTPPIAGSSIVTVTASDGAHVATANFRVTVGPNPAIDFTADGRPDVLVANTAGGVAVGSLNALNFDLRELVNFDPVPDRWRYATSADLNADGKADLVFQHEDGTIATSFVSDQRVMFTELIRPFSPADVAWPIAGVGDFNADGIPEFLHQAPTPSTAVAVGRLDPFRTGVFIQLLDPPVTPGTGARVATVADINADGKDDILFQNDAGFISGWHMNGRARLSIASLNPSSPPTGLRLVASGDFNQSGSDDFFFQPPDGPFTIWFMNGATRLEAQDIARPVDGGPWQVIGE